MKLKAPTSLPQLCADLGIKPPQLERLRVKYKTTEALLATLQQWWLETRERPRLLAKTTGYVDERFFALGGQITEAGFEDEPEAVDEVAQKRITMEARQRHAEDVSYLIAGAEEVIRALDERLPTSSARLTKHRIRRELDRFIEHQKRKAA